MTVTKLWVEGDIMNTFDRNTHLSRNTMEMLSKGICLNSTANPVIRENGRWEQNGNKTECALLEMVYKLGCDFRSVRNDIKVVAVSRRKFERCHSVQAARR
jgi:magnesium-transporting ATPase (P-type)